MNNINNLKQHSVFVTILFVSIALLGGGLIGCSSVLKIQSEPSGAEAFIAQQDSTDRKLLGRTPVEIKYSELRDKLGSNVSPSDMLVVTLELQDMETQKIFVPPTSFGTTNINVQVKMASKKEVGSANNILQWLHNAQKFAQGGEFERAHIEVDKVLAVDAKFVRALSMKGSVYYLQKNYDEAAKWFEKALATDGSFEEAVKMLNKIKQERK